ncbi:MAG: alpha-amylase family glycosyl hydrolase [Pseudomonadota bacterium]|nr:alpha-amylase family glycosyl hydrolase [Pseudomonadota bacterium]
MNKYALKKKHKIINDVNAIYSYILTSSEIKKLSNHIIKLIKFTSSTKATKIKEKDILLITYADTLTEKRKKSLKVLNNFMNTYLKDSINIVHILPFYPSSSDGGFAVTDFFKIDSKHGNWNDIKKISKNFQIMSDVVLNHASSKSIWFENFLKNNGVGKDFFLNFDKEINTKNVIRARSHKLIQKFSTKIGDKFLWCTFSRDQIDFDFKNPKVLLMFIKLILFFKKKGINFFRFDAVAFIWKRLDTSCINLDQTHAIVRLFRTLLESTSKNCKIVTETNLPFHENLSYFGNSDEANIIYNFSLAPLIINMLIKGNSAAFRRWSMSMPPAKDDNCYLNFLATHDGIGLRPLEGILDNNDLKILLKALKNFGSKFTYRKDRNNKKVIYEANISLFDALSGTVNGKDYYSYDRFYCAHAIMLSFEGLPAFYIHSLFGTKNNYNLFNKTKINRSINRSTYNHEYITKMLNIKNSHVYKVFTNIMKLIKVRKIQTAFHPNATQYTLNLGNNFFGIWRQSIDKKQSVFAIYNITNKNQRLNINKLNILSLENWIDLISIKKLEESKSSVKFSPYQFMWITNKT